MPELSLRDRLMGARLLLPQLRFDDAGPWTQQIYGRSSAVFDHVIAVNLNGVFLGLSKPA